MLTPNERVELLKKARALIDLGWTQRVRARDQAGQPVYPNNSYAVSFCMLGACERVGIGDVGRTFEPVGITLRTIADYNDLPTRKKEEVLGVFDRAITVWTRRANKHTRKQ